ncbi:AraC family transcriptional regulator [Saccharibacillus sp. CPCC 101409]|uniref:AraC family transcriptional regulator n=1 Tax=Saccharibacillus sp. CPCC 101409 TaxID=3058041 RepID=UPI0026718EC6|nr:AraC family transcriptional regulator [Saccharibacillus sp. CPCC 101409]MDO3413193.1 AraC family transcriptional regulator [Saccharibacillus sp. CPCC 101409]
MDYTACIQRALDYIEDRLKEPLTAEELAKFCGFSLYHFYKVFQSQTGLPVMDYVRRRRLAHAAADMAGSRTLLAIALDYGFETHAGFTRAFRKTYGLTPEQYRIHATGSVPERVDLAKLADYQLSGGMMMRPTFVTKPEIKLAGYALKTKMNGENFTEIPAFWNQYIEENRNRTLHEQLNPVSHAEYGACVMLPDEPEHFLYVIGVEVDSFDDLPEGLDTAVIPPSTYAVFTSNPADRADGAFSRSIQGMTRYVYGEWFPTSGYAYAKGGVDFELYDERSDGDTGLQMDLYVPVEKKE